MLTIDKNIANYKYIFFTDKHHYFLRLNSGPFYLPFL